MFGQDDLRSESSSRDTNDGLAVRNILHSQGACADSRSVPNLDPWENRGPGSDEGVGAHGYTAA